GLELHPGRNLRHPGFGDARARAAGRQAERSAFAYRQRLRPRGIADRDPGRDPVRTLAAVAGHPKGRADEAVVRAAAVCEERGFQIAYFAAWTAGAWAASCDFSHAIFVRAESR